MASKYSKPIICFLSLFTCLLMISCNVFVKDSPTDIIKSLADDLRDNADEWDLKDFQEALAKRADAILKFSQSQPDKKTYEDFCEALEDFTGVSYDLTGNTKRKFEKAERQFNEDETQWGKIKSALPNLIELNKKLGNEFDAIDKIIIIYDLYHGDHEVPEGGEPQISL